MKRLFAAALLASLTGGCAPSTTGPGPDPVRSADPARLRQQMTSLPGAQPGGGDPPSVSYPGTVLFAEGAAIPLAGGTALLDPLASFLAAQGGKWRATVRAHTGTGGEHDRVLAEKRAEMLRRYFHARGVPPDRVEFAAEGAEGAPLELVPLQPARDASSSRSKP